MAALKQILNPQIFRGERPIKEGAGLGNGGVIGTGFGVRAHRPKRKWETGAEQC